MTRASLYWSHRPDAVIDKLTLPDGPFPLSVASIDEHITPGRPGVYVLLEVEEISAGLVVARVGRSDTDLNRRLKRYLMESEYRDDERYDLVTHFSFGNAETAQSAFETQCVLYHDWEPRLNVHHPGQPRGSHACCPVHEEDPCPALQAEE